MGQAAQALRLLMMHDKQGKCLLILPADLELQPDLLEAATGRKLIAIAPGALQRYFRQPGMRRAAGQAKLFSSLPSYADTRVNAEDAVLIEATTGMLIDIDLTQTHLQQIPRANLGKALASDAEMPRVPNQRIESVVYQHTQKRIGDRIEETFAIPALSPTTQKLIDLRSNPDAGVEQLVPVVSSDPSLSAQVVAWANSPMFAAPGRAKSIEDAVVRILGYDLVLNLSIFMLLGSELKFDMKGPRGAVPFWMRALATARLTEMLARQMPVTRRPAIGLVYLTGLLHNFGTLLLAHLFSPQYTKLCRTIELNPHIEQWRLEQSLLGVDSAQLAAWLFKHWSLPQALVDAVRWQFQPEAAPNKSPLAMLISLSSRLLREQGLSDGPVEALPEGMSELLGLRYPQIEEAVSQFETIREDLEETVSQLNN